MDARSDLSVLAKLLIILRRACGNPASLLSALSISTSPTRSGSARRKRARVWSESNRELAQSCDIMMSAVTANQALNAAEQNAPYLDAGSSLRRPEFRIAGREAIHRARHRSLRRPLRRNRDDGSRSAVRPQSADARGRRRRTGICRKAGAVWNLGRDRFSRSGHGCRHKNVPQHHRQRHGSAASPNAFWAPAATTPTNASSRRWPKPSPASIGSSWPIIWLAAWWCTANAAPARWKKWPRHCARSTSSPSWPKPSCGAWTGASRQA